MTLSHASQRGRCLVIVCFLLASLPRPAAAEMRTWTDSTGAFSVQAEFVKMDGDLVVLRQGDGSELQVPLDRLSKTDVIAVTKALSAPKSANPFESRPSGTMTPPANQPATPSAQVQQAAGASASQEPPKSSTADAPAVTLDLAIEAGTPSASLDGFIDWDVSVDGLSRETLRGDNPIRFHANRTSVHDKTKSMVLHAGGAKLAIGYEKGWPRNNHTTICVVDLLAGRETFNGSQKGHWTLRDISADGRRALVSSTPEQFDNGHRLQVWWLEERERGRRGLENMPIARTMWEATPFGDAVSWGKTNVEWARFLSGSVVAVMKKEDGVVGLFDTDAEEAVFTFEKVVGRPAVSPNGRLLAVLQNETLGVYDVDAGEVVGAVPVGRTSIFSTIAFTSDGSQLLLVNADRMQAFDVASGEIVADIPVGSNTRFTMPEPDSEAGAEMAAFNQGRGHWGSELKTNGRLDDGLYAIGNLLVHEDFDLPLWGYTGHEFLVPFDGYLLAGINKKVSFTSRKSRTSVGDGVVVPIAEPRSAIKEARQRAAALDDLYALATGGEVAIDVSKLPADKQAQAREGLVDALRNAGHTVSDRSNLKLVATVERGESQEMEYYKSRSFGPAPPIPGFGTPTGERVKMSVTPYVSTVTLMLDGEAEPLWSTNWSSLPTFVSLGENVSMQAAVTKANRPNYGYYEKLKIPSQAMHPRYAGQTFGGTQITPAGLNDVANTFGK